MLFYNCIDRLFSRFSEGSQSFSLESLIACLVFPSEHDSCLITDETGQMEDTKEKVSGLKKTISSEKS